MHDAPIDRWIAIEMAKVRESLVTAPRSLADLLMEESPSAPTRSGAPHAFDRAVLERFRDALSPLDRRRLRLPITVYVEHDLPEDAYFNDEVTARLLESMRDVPQGLTCRDGRYWVGHARARAIAARHPTAFQFVTL